VKNLLSMLVLFAAVCLPTRAQAQAPIRVNCGGPAYTDSKGHLWQADTGYNGGHTNSTTESLGGTVDQALYQTARYNNSGSAPLVYTFSVPNGTYNINLLFAEWNPSFESVGARVFNVKIQGSLAFPNVDIFASAGAQAALVKSTSATVQSGTLQIEFDNVVQVAKIDAIEILPVPPQSPQLTLNFFYPDGTPVVGTLNYSLTSSLLSFQGSEPLTNGLARCVLFASPDSMGISAQFQVNLSLSDNRGNVLWQIALQANPAQVNLASVQSSTLTVIVQKI
jgi:Malectin domain